MRPNCINSEIWKEVKLVTCYAIYFLGSQVYLSKVSAASLASANFVLLVTSISRSLVSVDILEYDI